MKGALSLCGPRFLFVDLEVEAEGQEEEVRRLGMGIEGRDMEDRDILQVADLLAMEPVEGLGGKSV